MARLHTSLKSAHLLMWSSPVLLLVLVFTLTTSGPRTTAAPTMTPTTTPFSATPAPTTTTTTRSRPAPTTTTSTTPTPPTTGHPAESNFASVTDSTARSVAPVPNAPALSGALAGELTPGSPHVEVPLLGPGAWTLQTNGSTTEVLSCATVSGPTSAFIVVGPDQSCQLQITSTAVGTSIAWQLVPTR